MWQSQCVYSVHDKAKRKHLCTSLAHIRQLLIIEFVLCVCSLQDILTSYSMVC